MNKASVRLAALAAVPLLCFATSTKTWLSSSYADFEKGERKGVSVRSDGRITLAPKQEQLFDASVAYLWAMARDSKGAIYAGGGPGARVFRYSDGKCEKIAEFDAVEVHAIAIDRQDRVYAATFPDGKIYRLPASTPGAKPELFYDPQCKYIWTMLFDDVGNLFVATGDNGEIRRVTPGGKGEVFFRSEDANVRSMVWSGKDLIAGTDPTGLVIRVDGRGQGYVLYQLPKREVTALAVNSDGAIYAAGSGIHQSNEGASALLGAIAVAAGSAPPAHSGAPGGATVVINPSGPATPDRPAPRAPLLTGGSEVFRIDRSGQPSRVWSHAQDVVYAIAFDSSGLPVLGAGNKGNLYRIDTPSLYTALMSVDANQITALLPGPKGSFLAATANVGKVYRIGPELGTEGSVTSDVFDSGSFSTWGRLTGEGDKTDQIHLEAHSGNLDRPRNFWSQWSATPPPPARFTQWRATLTAVNGVSPTLDSVEQAYLTRNVAPEIGEIEPTPPNYKFPAPIVAAILSRSPATLSLPPLGQRQSRGIALGGDSDSSSSMTYAKGWVGVRWSASDENSDLLTYTLSMRGVNETEWKPLKDKLSERHYTFDSTAFPDGEYRIRVTASDQPGNTAGEALTGELVSGPLLIDNTPPVISGLKANFSGDTIHVNWKAVDAKSVIKHAEYCLDGQDWLTVDPVSKLSDSQTLEYALTVAGMKTGEHTIAVRVSDDYENTAVEKVVTH